MKKPEIIYKYEPFSVQSLKNLKAQCLYYGSPLGFNDPYDCALKASILEPNDKELEKIRNEYIKQENIPNNVLQLIQSSNGSELRKILMALAQNALELLSHRFLKMRGVTCFSETNSDLLMWSHYGGKYRGFCLGFCTNHEPFKKIYKVKYTSDIPKITLASILLKGNIDSILELFCTKSKSWTYEQEWRGIHQEAGTAYTYESSALKAIYFGPDIDFESFEIIALILAGQNSEVELWEGTRSTDKFEVLFKKVTYTSYIEAKRNGLRP